MNLKLDIRDRMREQRRALNAIEDLADLLEAAHEQDGADHDAISLLQSQLASSVSERTADEATIADLRAQLAELQPPVADSGDDSGSDSGTPPVPDSGSVDGSTAPAVADPGAGDPGVEDSGAPVEPDSGAADSGAADVPDSGAVADGGSDSGDLEDVPTESEEPLPAEVTDADGNTVEVPPSEPGAVGSVEDADGNVSVAVIPADSGLTATEIEADRNADEARAELAVDPVTGQPAGQASTPPAPVEDTQLDPNAEPAPEDIPGGGEPVPDVPVDPEAAPDPSVIPAPVDDPQPDPTATVTELNTAEGEADAQAAAEETAPADDSPAGS